MRRFYLSDFTQLRLREEEAHHCVHVLRLKPGDSISVFDGQGREAQCRIQTITAEGVHLALLQQSRTMPLPCRITLAQAIPRKNMDWIVQKATELGVHALAPLVSERSVAEGAEVSSSKLARWRSIALEASKQSGNNWLPDIQPPRKAREFLGQLPAADLKLIGSLQPDARPLKAILSSTPTLQHSKTPSVLVLIGPEGDFTPAELALAVSSGCQPWSLGPLVLRADTAALYALSILHHELQVG